MKCIGIMTGNSLDAIDVVLTEFNNSSITDICAHSKDIPLILAEKFRNLKQLLVDNNGNIEEIYHNNPDDFMNLHNEYVNLVAKAVNELIEKFNISKSEISVSIKFLNTQIKSQHVSSNAFIINENPPQTFKHLIKYTVMTSAYSR